MPKQKEPNPSQKSPRGGSGVQHGCSPAFSPSLWGWGSCPVTRVLIAPSPAHHLPAQQPCCVLWLSQTGTLATSSASCSAAGREGAGVQANSPANSRPAGEGIKKAWMPPCSWLCLQKALGEMIKVLHSVLFHCYSCLLVFSKRQKGEKR